MGKRNKDIRDRAWDQALAFFTQVRDDPENPETIESLVLWVNQSPAHLDIFNELAAIWVAAGMALARQIEPLGTDDDSEQDGQLLH